MTTDQIVAALNDRKNQFTTDDIKKISAALRAAHSRVIASVALDFDVGAKVTFVGKFGRPVEGTITKVNQKTLNVKATDGVNWKVGPTLVTKINEFSPGAKVPPVFSHNRAPTR